MRKPAFKTKILPQLLLLSLPFFNQSLYAATLVRLNHASPTNLAALISPTMLASSSTFTEMNREIDSKHIIHIRMQQNYLGHKVLGGQFAIHKKQDKSNLFSTTYRETFTGKVYTNIENDIGDVNAIKANMVEEEKAFNHVLNLAKKDYGVNQINPIQEKKLDLIVYIDEQQKAHWAYEISFIQTKGETEAPVKPIYLIDAQTQTVYRHWNDIKTENLTEKAFAGGVGGNKKIGKLNYDGLITTLPKLNIQYDAKNKLCHWANAETKVKSYHNNKIMTFACKETDPKHNNIYWIGEVDKVNDGYGPAVDALFAGEMIREMYNQWYQLPVLGRNKDGSAKVLNMVVHQPKYDNAYWDGKKMIFGDGDEIFYPLTSLGVASHEISHGFTDQYSKLIYWGQSGALNESFSDMASEAANYFVYGKNEWQIGPEIFKAKNEALRYMDQPSKDCHGAKPGHKCSIDDVTQYKSGLDVHYGSGVFNRLFYLLSTSDHWDAKKSFDVMVQANRFYWQEDSNFSEAACGILKAGQDFGYELNTIKAAIAKVNIDISEC